MHSPKVTAFVPVYNRERFVGKAIESLLAQTFSDFELLLIDDGSTDDSLRVMRSYGDPRIRIERNPRNLGVPVTRNEGLRLARGEYIALLDSDDYAYPDRFERQVAFLDRHPDFAEIGGWNRAMDAHGRPLRKVKIQPLAPEDIRATLLFRCCLKNRSIMGRTALLREHGYRADYVRCQDYDLHVRLAEQHKLGNLPRVLVLGRLHEGRHTLGTADLGNETKMQIMAAQLAALDLGFGQDDLERHLLLAHANVRAARFALDEGYLDWAERWLGQIVGANRRAGRYDEGALARAVGEIWFRTCLRVATHAGWGVWRRFLPSTLSAGAWPSLRAYAAAMIFHGGWTHGPRLPT